MLLQPPFLLFSFSLKPCKQGLVPAISSSINEITHSRKKKEQNHKNMLMIKHLDHICFSSVAAYTQSSWLKCRENNTSSTHPKKLLGLALMLPREDWLVVTRSESSN